MKTTPFAVAGRWRAIAMPATATRDRAAPRRRSALESDPGGRCGRSSSSGCTPTERLVVAVVGEHRAPTPTARAAPASPRSGRAEARAAAPRRPSRARSRSAATRPSSQRSSRRGCPNESQAPDGDERLQPVRVDRRALREVDDAVERAAALPLRDERLRLVLADRRRCTRARCARRRPRSRTSPRCTFTSGGRTSTPRRCASRTRLAGG